MYFERQILKNIEGHLFKGKIIIIYGPRQIGKTTLASEILEKYKIGKKAIYLNADNITVQENLMTQDSLKLKQYLGDTNLVIIDEAQRSKNIGCNLKILVDTYPEIQIIATGSSSFDLANEIKEPLTGRVWEYFLPPISLNELTQQFANNQLYSLLPNLINYGLYPGVLNTSGEETRRLLEKITESYLFKDILDFEGQKNSDFVFKLLKLLAFQIGNEVSYNELATILGASKSLVEKYIYLLEQTFVIYRLSPFSRNLRNEVGKKRKIYFWDTGVRNALIQNFNILEIRPDIGNLWENFCITERLKYLKNNFLYRNSYFRRTYDKKEIDYIEEYDGKLFAYEIKWGKEKLSKYSEFLEAYPGSSIKLVNKSNFLDFAEGKI